MSCSVAGSRFLVISKDLCESVSAATLEKCSLRETCTLEMMASSVYMICREGIWWRGTMLLGSTQQNAEIYKKTKNRIDFLVLYSSRVIKSIFISNHLAVTCLAMYSSAISTSYFTALHLVETTSTKEVARSAFTPCFTKFSWLGWRLKNGNERKL